jgi:asparagine synthetase B (glutamine-hydrolysing)
MSDFIYSSSRIPPGRLTAELDLIYSSTPPKTQELHGPWGSLAVSQSTYNGFAPVETESHICTVIGGPVLYFRDNRFLTGPDPQAGTRAILERWLCGEVDWSEDLSGPFAVLIVDKHNNEVTMVTDLMMFIPVYQYKDDQCLMLGTHIDALARACAQQDQFDEDSLAEFILNSFISYPYTAYQRISQCHAATKHLYTRVNASSPPEESPPHAYWLPEDKNPYKDLADAAVALREGMSGYVNRITEGMDHVAQFLSAGEDSRVLAGMIPERLQRDAFVFSDSMNREARIAQKVAKAYNINLHFEFRDPIHYFNMLPEASTLIGSGLQYTHSHSVGLQSTSSLLPSYPAVFGGYLSDTMLKGYYITRNSKWSGKIAFLPQFDDPGIKPAEFDNHKLKLLNIQTDLISSRRNARLEAIKKIRKSTISEWFYLWPSTMHDAMPNWYSTRRLFASYEPYLCKEVVKLFAAAPASWKLNRRLFHKAFHPYLSKSLWIRHGDGRLPYFPWWVNMFIQAPTWTFEQVMYRSGIQKTNPGPWADWKNIISSTQWKNAIETAHLDSESTPRLRQAISDGALTKNTLTIDQKTNFLQVCCLVNSARHRPLPARQQTQSTQTQQTTLSE